jgi:hypothetical protein
MLTHGGDPRELARCPMPQAKVASAFQENQCRGYLPIVMHRRCEAALRGALVTGVARNEKGAAFGGALRISLGFDQLP